MNSIEETQNLQRDKDYFEKKYKEAKEVIKEKDKIITELKKNLENTKTKTLLLLC